MTFLGSTHFSDRPMTPLAVPEPLVLVERKVVEERAPVNLSAANSMYQQCLQNYERLKVLTFTLFF
jgi:hypothetical protein